jgi:hypothetical protein
VISLSGLDEPRQRSGVAVAGFALVDGGTVPLESITLERLDDALRGARLFPRRIDILNTQQPAAASTTGLQITRSRGEQ